MGRYFIPRQSGLVAIVCLLTGMIIVLVISIRANNPSVPELAGRWSVTKMENVPQLIRYYMWENLIFKIDARGLLGNRDTPFTMIVLREGCSPNCYYVYDSYYGDPLYTLVRENPDRLYLYAKHPDKDFKITFDRYKTEPEANGSVGLQSAK
jgi:hypothetical protein